MEILCFNDHIPLKHHRTRPPSNPPFFSSRGWPESRGFHRARGLEHAGLLEARWTLSPLDFPRPVEQRRRASEPQ
eukprot:7940385-Lingulodinium_polyedra.AAC.1